MVQFILINLAVFFTSVLAHGLEFEQSLASAQCRDAVTKQLRTLKSQNAWIRQVDIPPDTYVFRSPTAQIGEWVEIRFPKDKRPLVYRVTPKSTDTFEFDGEKCTTKTTLVAYQNQQVGQSNGQNDVPLFTDETL